MVGSSFSEKGTATIEHRRLAVSSEIELDPRGVVWLPSTRTLVVADLHLGYAWVQRQRGALLPIHPTESTIVQLRKIAEDLKPRRIVVLGDLVHSAAQIPAIEDQVMALVRLGHDWGELVLVLGNHDRQLPQRLSEWGLEVVTTPRYNLGAMCLEHGDRPLDILESVDTVTFLIGHEHPSITLSHGVATRARCPCFLWSRHLLVLPAFSPWTQGCNVRRREFLGPRAQQASFEAVIVCMGSRLLKIPWEKLGGTTGS